MSDTSDRVKKLLIEHLGVNAEKITDDASLYDDLGADSLDVVELTMAFEEEFGIKIGDDEAEKFQTVANCVELIDAKRGG
jgi:acyl carrier protein